MIKTKEDLEGLKESSLETFVCSNCGKTIQKSVSAITWLLKTHGKLICHKCNLRRAFREKYGVDNISQLESIKRKKDETKLKNFGDPNFNNRKKARETCIVKYGVDSPMKMKEVQQKQKETLIQKYGVPVPLQNEKIKEKMKRTNIKRYGVDNVAKSEEIKKKSRETCRERYGVDHALSCPEIIEKGKNTSLKKYGKPNNGFLAKPKSYLYEGQVFDSSWELAYWIWCIDNGISIERNHQSFKRDDGGLLYPDFIVNGELIEIKGEHLKKKEEWLIKLKCYQDNNIKILSWVDVKPMVRYIEEKYGKGYLKSWRRG
jgi:DNA-directed RNA polymerase subunit RPC12/RpoP